MSKGHFFEMNTSDLRAFVYVIELGSFSRAAEALGVSQPTVSLRLRHLEDRLGLKLLERRHGIALTPVGRSLYNRARQVLAQLERFERSAEDLAQLRDGRLRVGISTPRFAMRLLGRFRNAHPGVSLELSLGNSDTLLDRLQRSEIDAAIMTLRAPPDGVHAWRTAARARLSRHPPVAKATDDLPTRWGRFKSLLEDGTICLANKAAERSLRGVAPDRTSRLFAGYGRRGDGATIIYTFVGTAKLDSVDPQASLADGPRSVRHLSVKSKEYGTG